MSTNIPPPQIMKEFLTLLKTLPNDVNFLVGISGTCCGCWIYLFNKSGLHGLVALASLLSVQALFLLTCCTGKFDQLKATNWWMLLGAAFIGGIGMITFTRIGFLLPPSRVSGPYAAATMIQVLVFIGILLAEAAVVVVVANHIHSLAVPQ